MYHIYSKLGLKIVVIVILVQWNFITSVFMFSICYYFLYSGISCAVCNFDHASE